MNAAVVLMTNRFSPVVEILQEARMLSLRGIIYEPLPDTTDRKMTEFVKRNDIPLFRDLAQFIRAGHEIPAFLAVYSWHKILKKEEFGLPEIAALNLHPSRLPLYKGRNPWQAQFEDHVECSGFTVHKITPDIDGGEIISQKTFVVDYSLPFETIIENSLRDVGGPLLRDTLIELWSKRTH